MISQREVGVDVPTFDIGVIKALRQDPDVILVGEMRDLATIAAAVRAAETGHLVFSTLHTTGAARTVDRIVDVFPFDQQEQIRTMLSNSLSGVVSQMLVQKKPQGRVAAFEVMMATAAIKNCIRERKTHQIISIMQTGAKQGMICLNDSLAKLVLEGTVDPKEALAKTIDRDELRQKLAVAGVEA